MVTIYNKMLSLPFVNHDVNIQNNNNINYFVLWPIAAKGSVKILGGYGLQNYS